MNFSELLDLPIRIDSVELFELDLGLKSSHKSAKLDISTRPLLITKIETDIGPGWGESAAFSQSIYGGQNISDCKSFTAQLGENLLGTQITIREFSNLAKAPSWFSFAAIEMALLSTAINAHGWPEETSLGASIKAGPVCGDGWTQESVRQLCALRFDRVKLKVTPAVDVGLLSRLVAEHPDVRFDLDGNESFTESDFDLSASLLDAGIGTFEQPFPTSDLATAKLLVERCAPSQRVCADEAAVTPELALQAIAAGATNAICIKPSRHGGLANGLELAKQARDEGIDIVVGGMLEAGIGRSFLALFNILCEADLTGDITPANFLYSSQPFTDLELSADNVLQLPNQLSMLSIS